MLARKPLSESTIAANCLKWGTGALNIDGCRVATNGEQPSGGTISRRATWNESGFNADGASTLSQTPASGRWPANLVLSGCEEVVGAFPQSKDGVAVNLNKDSSKHSGNRVFAARNAVTYDAGYGSSGSAARFFASFPLEDTCHSTSSVSDAEKALSLQSERAVSVLSNAVAQSTRRLVLQTQSYRAHSTTVTARELRLICAAVTELIQNIERRYLLGLPLESITATLGPVTCAATPSLIGTTTIIVSRSTSDHSVELVTFDTIETSAEAGASGYAKRFHYTSKADSDDRLGSAHPTVKPVDLMQWLVRLVTPKGGLVLDPFAGTGTTGEAAWREGMRAVLIEREEEYQADIRRRMALALAGPDERSRESVKARGKTETHETLPLFAGVEVGKFTSAA